jgi:hypothetical protein
MILYVLKKWKTSRSKKAFPVGVGAMKVNTIAWIYYIIYIHESVT